jgi:hypothetical protein
MLAWLVVACVQPVGLIVDASEVAAVDPDAVVILDVVFNGEAIEHIELDLLESDRAERPELLDPRLAYGFVGFADLNRDGVCEPSPIDLPWVLIYQPARGVDMEWVLSPADAAEMADACGFYAAPPTLDDEPDPLGGAARAR